MALILFMSGISVAAALFTLKRFMSWRTILKCDKLIDVSFTVLVGFLFFGTMAGMAVAVTAGLGMAVFLSTMKGIAGLSKPRGERFSKIRTKWSQMKSDYALAKSEVA